MKKTPTKRRRQGAVKRSGSRKKTVKHSAAKTSAKKSYKYKKAPIGTVVLESKATFSPYALRALSIFSAGVQRALKQMAERNIPAVIIENGRRVEAVPTKIGGRYVVADSQGSVSGGRSTNGRKRGVRVG